MSELDPEPQASEYADSNASLRAQVDVAVIGGGVIGLSIAWQLAKLGRRVCVLERNDCLESTSTVATGMLAPHAEFKPGYETLFPSMIESLDLWSTFAKELQDDAECEIGYEKSGALFVAQNRDEFERLKFRLELHNSLKIESYMLGYDDLHRQEPALKPTVQAAIYCPLDHHVNPLLTLKALMKACRRYHVELIESCVVTRHLREHGDFSLTTSQGKVRTQVLVVATGAWNGAAQPDLIGIKLPIKPVRGQTILLRRTALSPSIQSLIWSDQVHIAQRQDGTLCIGATVEEQGFHRVVTAGGVYFLLHSAQLLVPSIIDMEIISTRAGFRPTTEDEQPIIDCLEPELYIAAGHHRNGFLFAPLTAYSLSRYVDTGVAPKSIQPFGLKRFSHDSIC